MDISSNKIFEPGEKVICVLTSSTYLEFGETYIVKECEFSNSFGFQFVTLDHEDFGYDRFNSARFISLNEIRDFQINKLLNE